MKNSYLTLYVEINDTNFIFFVTENDEQNNFKLSFKLAVPLNGIENNRITDYDIVYNIIKENIYFIEQKFNHTFKDIVLIIENFNPKFVNISGFKKLNGSQILRENITYILNTLKSCVDKIEINKNVVHIFNSKFNLDNKKIENLPIGLFGDFYSHELSFVLINSNDHRNLKNIFNKCNLKIKKILIKSFVEGAVINKNYKDNDTFFYIKINENNSKIFYFENNSLKSEQNFKFGMNIILKDISKITALKIDTIKNFLDKTLLTNELSEDDLIENSFFQNIDYIKIKKKLIYQIASARVQELFELMFLKNINFHHYNKVSNVIYLEIDKNLNYKGLEEIYKTVFSMNGKFDFNILDDLSDDSTLDIANELVHFGWKKEAIPVTQSKKTLIARFFDVIFG
tara:strand:+ start:2350 stop:3546 length:1197 start_codon:yes stop_codon:yes gene_type:complete